MPSRKARNGTVEGLTSFEWKAVATLRRFAVMPASASFFSTASIAEVAPESTTCSGALWFATTTSMPHASSFGRRSSIFATTAVIEPDVFAAASRMSSPRLRAMRSRSASVIAPAAWSAVTSPKLWPATATGESPMRFVSSRSARLAAPIAGCAHSVAVRRASFAALSAGLKTVFG